MARANAARTDSREDIAPESGPVQAQSFATGLDRPWRQPARNFASRFEPWLIRLVPIFITLFLVTLALVATLQAYAERDRILLSAQKDLAFTFRMMATQFDQTANPATPDRLPEQLEQLLQGSNQSNDRHTYLTDENGVILAEHGASKDHRNKIDDILGINQPVTTFAELAGVIPITLTDGRPALVAAQNLPNRHQQLIVTAPYDGILAAWRYETNRQSLLLFSVAVLLSITAMAYFWQASRAGEAEIVCDEIRTRIDTALNRGKCGLWDWDIARGRIYWSASMFEILGLDPRQHSLSFGELNQMVHPGDANLTKIAESIAAEENKTIDQVFRMRNAAGNWVWLRMRAEVVQTAHMRRQNHIVGIAMDISEEKKHRDSSHIADLRLRDAIDSISEAFVLWDANNCLAMCNANYRELHQISADEPCIGLAYQDFLQVSTPPTIQTPINFDAQKAQSARTYEAQLMDGRWLQINERRTRDGGYVSVGTDITKLKQHEEQLLQSERRLMGTIADQRRSRQILETQAQQLADLADGSYLSSVISDVLEMSRLESGDVLIERSYFQMGTLFERLMDKFGEAAKRKNISLTLKNSGSSQIHADPDAIDKILQPLMHNAIKFTPERGKVKLTSTLFDDGTLHLVIVDDGIGIAPQALEHIGKPFEQADAALENGMKGSGLGLAIARSLVELHGGTIQIHSQLRRGTQVDVRIPRCQTIERVKLAAKA
eukprot:gene9560-9636_t